MSLKKINVYLVNHTHWDREWYFSNQDSLILSDMLFTNTIKELEKHPEASFTLDGQISILDDYVAIHPEMNSRIKHLVNNHQLQIGPWYTQPDALHVLGESLFRNGMIGELCTSTYGKRMSVGYLPDTFGFNSQLPVVLDELGLNSFVFWRGIDTEKTSGCYFKWHSLGNSRTVTAINMPQGYSTGMLLDASDKYVKQRLDPAVAFVEKQSAEFQANVLIPTGNDQMNIINDFSNKVDKINLIGKYRYQVSDYQTFIQKVSHEPSLHEYKGEFIDPILARVHRTCGSSRMDIKIAATQLEDKLIHQVEPLLVIGMKCGVDLGNYVLITAWKKLLDSQAHDSMAGSVVDSVAEDILHRLKEAHELADSISNTIERLISLRLKLDQNQVLVFNPLPRNTTDYFQIQIVSPTKNVCFSDVEDSILIASKKIKKRDHILKQTSSGDKYITEPEYYINDYFVKTNLPSLGYKILDFHTVSVPSELKATTETKIVTKQFTVEFVSGHVNLRLNDGTAINDFISLEDRGNAGDTYDYSPLYGDKTVSLHFKSVKVLRSGHYQEMHLNGMVKLPSTLNDRQHKEFNTDYKFSIVISFINELMHAHISIDNQIFDHKLVLAVNTGIMASQNIASVPFGYLVRRKQSLRDWKKHFVEKPVSSWPLDNNVTVQNKNYSVTVFSKTIKEYEQLDTHLLFTLLATTNQLGKADLINRPGRASGDTTKVGHPIISTPGAEIIGKHDYDVQISFDKRFDELSISKKQEQLYFQPLSYQIQDFNLFLNRLDNKLQDDLAPVGKLPIQLSLFNIPDNLSISACYLSYFGGNAMILRLFNPTGLPVAYELPKNVQAVNALEVSSKYKGLIKAYDLLSLKITF